MRKQLLITLLLSGLLCLLGYAIFYPIFYSTTIIIPFAIHPFNIVQEYPTAWKWIKCIFVISYFLSSLILSHILTMIFFSRSSKTIKGKEETEISDSSLQLLLGKNMENKSVFLSQKALFQNILITGTIGTGKTSSSMYPFTKQLLYYKAADKDQKLAILILDVKGNYSSMVKQYCKECNRLEDLSIICLGKKIKYNPLDKPHLKPAILANRLRTILTLFSPNNTEDYWLDKSEEVLREAIKLCRLYNHQYVTFEEIHKIITSYEYYQEKVSYLKNLFLSHTFSSSQEYDLLTALQFFEKEFFSLDIRTLSILKSEITRITNVFVSDYEILSTFCPKQEEISFHGFQEVLEKGKIVTLQMNIAEYKNLSKIIAAYLKLDFQTEVLLRLKKKATDFRPCAFICDEYHEYATTTDSLFFSQSREAKCINIVATQSYTSLLNTLHDKSAVEVILQSLTNKLWFRNDDLYTIESCQKQLGKEEKIKVSQNVSENAQETNINYLTLSLDSKKSNISEGFTKYTELDFCYDFKFLTQELETFSCLAFLSDGDKILPPQKLNLIPYFKKEMLS